MLREKHLIDFFKGCSAPVILWMMWNDGRMASPTCWVYLAIHGTYGWMWVLKSYFFGDKSWERPLVAYRAVMIVSGLMGYWVAPFLLIRSQEEASALVLGSSVAIFALGVFLHFVSDMQKSLHLKYSPGKLLREGLWRKTRNPNYLGELLIYTSFSLLSLQRLPWVLFSLVILIEWIPNLVRKDRSLSRYPDFNDYRRGSWILFPKFF